LFFDPYDLLPRGQNSSPASGTSSDIAGKIRAIRSDPKHAYNVATHAEHQRAVEEIAALYARLPFPEPISDEIDITV
jgi:hypothetical protein